MNCYNHYDAPAAAQCMDCGRGLCVNCLSHWEIPICDICNKKRANAERTRIIKELLITLVAGIIGVFVAQEWMAESFDSKAISIISSFSLFAGIVSGWKALSSMTPRAFLILPLIGWVIYFVLKLWLAAIIGGIALPIRTFKNIRRLKQINLTLSVIKARQ